MEDKIVTANHCVVGSYAVIHNGVILQVLSQDFDRDIAILAPDIIINGMSQGNASVGEYLTIIGFPGYYSSKTIEQCIIIDEDTNNYYTSGCVWFGQSGSPAINKYGQVVGVVVAVRPVTLLINGEILHREVGVISKLGV
jgi:hypothetical protein